MAKQLKHQKGGFGTRAFVLKNAASNKLAVVMAESFMPASLQEIWNACNVRGFMILSLFLQVLLAYSAPLRKASSSRFFLFVIWSAYFMADWVATFTFGLISNAQRIDSISPSEINENLMAFWAAFLLIHLGGPDTITAFSLEDNALWMRHLVGLVAQLSTFFYILFKTLPDNNLVDPTILIAVAGAIKYGERTRSLYLASMENLKKSTGKLPVTSLEALEGGAFQDKSGEEAYYFFQIFKGLVVEINPNHAQRSQSREFFLLKDAKGAFDLTVAELGLLFDLFYTKISSLNSWLGILLRITVSYSVIGALVLYCLLEKEGFQEVDIWITYFLLAGAVALEMTNGLILPLSNWTGPFRWFHICWILLQVPCFIIPVVTMSVLGLILSIPCGCYELVHKTWSKKLGALSLLSRCIEHCHRGGNKPLKYAHLIYRTVTRREKRGVSWNVFDPETRDFIFKELKERASAADDEDQVKEIYEARGSWILTKLGNSDGLMRYVKKFDYDRSVLAWHIATEICHNANRAVEAADHKQRKLAVKLSYYMHYLLIKKPEMMSAVAGIGHIRYGDTCAEVEHFCRVYKAETVVDFCDKILNEDTAIEPADVYKDKHTSVLWDACNLARLLMQKDNKWEIISGVWAELLMYAAGHCRPEKHARAVSEGGELVTIIWLLMAHLGIGAHFPYPED